ncbi:unnamed protein product [Ostreobium quekettii]|uniref:Tubulin-tyrosine ligase n=1 Tax=Ostreobium quekettii TaxID=121088 RepID=A0A8S1J266_9CHLO|nr:unnamed protein product [Ostreobium quekettii]
MPMDGSEVWIAKPSITNQGLSVCIFNRVADLEQAVQQAEDIREWVIQRYITPPLLIHGHKFHLRAYALCVGSLAVYVYDEVLVLLAGEEYDAGLNRLDNLASHLTNTCQQDGLDGEEGEKKVIKLLSELPQLLSEGGLPICKAKERVAAVETAVRSIIGECLEAVSGELNFFTMPNCFELFGFDLMVDADWNCWVLEANAEPDFKQTGQRLRCIVDGLVEGVLRLVADPLAEEQGVRPPGEQEGVIGKGRWRKVLEKEQRPFFA